MKGNDRSLFRQRCYVDGAWLEADDRATIEVTNPATSEVLGSVPRLGAEETFGPLAPSTASSASTPASSRPRSRPSAGWRRDGGGMAAR